MPVQAMVALLNHDKTDVYKSNAGPTKLSSSFSGSGAESKGNVNE